MRGSHFLDLYQHFNSFEISVDLFPISRNATRSEIVQNNKQVEEIE